MMLNVTSHPINIVTKFRAFIRSLEHLNLDASRPAYSQTSYTDQLEARRILLVEDEPGLREAFALTFELQGCEVLLANNGRDALDLLSGIRPDLIVTDYMMPHINGVELIQHARANADLADIPTLLMSASLPPHVDGAIADAFLPKPISMDRLLEVSTDLVYPQQPCPLKLVTDAVGDLATGVARPKGKKTGAVSDSFQ